MHGYIFKKLGRVYKQILDKPNTVKNPSSSSREEDFNSRTSRLQVQYTRPRCLPKILINVIIVSAALLVINVPLSIGNMSSLLIMLSTQSINREIYCIKTQNITYNVMTKK